MANILFLASWYPNRMDPIFGNFIKRHAEAVSSFHQVFVVCILKDSSLSPGTTEIIKEHEGSLHTYMAYYAPSFFGKGLPEKILSLRTRQKIFRRILKGIIAEHGVPHLSHLNVMMNAGTFALYARRKYGIPYVLSEHWSGYYRGEDGYRDKSFFYRSRVKKIYARSDFFLPVSDYLGRQMNRVFGKKEYRVIPNVADSNIMYPGPAKQNKTKRLLHVSSMVPLKNTDGLLRVIKKVADKRSDFCIHIVGEAPEEFIQWTKDEGLLNRIVFFMGLISYRQIAEELRASDALVLFSRFENLSCIIMEAVCCGIPVIATDVGGTTEIVNASNGMLVASENEEELEKAILAMLDRTHLYDKEKIAAEAIRRFSYDMVARQFSEVYKEVLARHQQK